MPSEIAYVKKCLDCDGEIPIPKNVVKGEVINCGNCGGTGYEVTEIVDGMPKVKYLEIGDEDWGE